MQTGAELRLTPEEYLALEREAEFKHEYIEGRILPWLGATVAHCEIMGAISASLRACFRASGCRAYMSQMRVQIAAGRSYLYPDVVAVCGDPVFLDEAMDTLQNPSLVVEVLSPTTEAYDRGEKFQLYRAIESLQEYVLVAQDRPLVERFVRHGEFWQLLVVSGLDAALELTSVGCTIPLREIYENVEFTAPAAVPGPEAEVRPS
jgi:Uma2 family endonuclease